MNDDQASLCGSFIPLQESWGEGEGLGWGVTAVSGAIPLLVVALAPTFPHSGTWALLGPPFSGHFLQDNELNQLVSGALSVS